MANVDNPNGFQPIRTLSGAAFADVIRTVPAGDGEDIFVGDAINLASGLALPADTGDTAIIGVAVGFGKVDGDGYPLGPYNPDSLTTRFYDDSASTHTEWIVYYAPADDVVFRIQEPFDLDLKVGDTADLFGLTGGNTTTGISGQELATTSNADVTCVGLTYLVGNDPTTNNAVIEVMFTRAAQAFHA